MAHLESLENVGDMLINAPADVVNKHFKTRLAILIPSKVGLHITTNHKIILINTKSIGHRPAYIVKVVFKESDDIKRVVNFYKN